jgi:fatty acid desaturase
MKLFKYPEDRLPVAVAVGLTVLDVAVYLAVRSPWLLVGYWLLMVIPKGVLSAWNHHHQHVPTFRFTVLNRLLELCYALHTGVTTHTWVLHHVLGHHQNFLDQAKDESRWKRADGQKMGVLQYTLEVAVTAYPRAFEVGRRYPTHQRQFLIFGALSFALVAALIAYKPLAGVMLFALPMVCSMLYTAWVTYDHHSGLDTDDHFHASYNNLNRWFNRLTGNLGYHTAHHYRQGVHWSRLPDVHARIEHQIPAHLFRKSTFDAMLPAAEAAEVSVRVSRTQQPTAAASD